MKRLLILCLALALLLCGCGANAVPTENTQITDATENPTPEEPVDEGGFGMSYMPAYGFNPYTCSATINRALFSLMYESLFTVSNQFRAEPLLCRTFTVSDDGMTYRFELVEGVRFSDGTALTAADVVASIQAAQKSSFYAARLSHIWGVTAEGDDTVVVLLDTPYENFCLMLDVPIVKAATVEQTQPIGTGAYRLTGTRLTRNALWWQPQPLVLDVDIITLNAADDPNEVRDHFEFGGTDLVYCDPNSAAAVGYRCDYEVWEVPTTVMHYIGFNLRSGYFANETLRKGVTFAIDRSVLLNNVYGGYALAASLPCSPQSDLYDFSLSFDYDYDLQAFQAAVHNSGVLESATYEEHTGIFLVCSQDPTRVAAARAVAEVLTAAGLNITVSALDREAYEDALEKHDFDLYFGEVRLTANFNLSEFFTSDGSLNYGSISDAGLAMLCTTALENSGDFVELCRQVMDSARICPVVFKSYVVCVTRGRIATMTPAVDCVLHNSANARSLTDAEHIPEPSEDESGDATDVTDTTEEPTDPPAG